MGLFQKKSVIDKELDGLQKKESVFLRKRAEKKDSLLNQKLSEKVPEKLQATLNTAFQKAFLLVFDKGTDVIERTYSKRDLEKNYKIQQNAADIKKDRKSLRTFTKKAGSHGSRNLMLSGVSGIGLGILGIGIPDIPLFTGLILKNIYEIALNYGYEYQSEEERRYILLLIQGAVSYGPETEAVNQKLNCYIETGSFPESVSMDEQVKSAANALSKELLYMKFLQGIPVVGAVGGAYDAIYMRRITEYAQLKYHRRFLLRQKERD